LQPMTASPRPHISNERVRWADVDLVGIMRFSAFTRLVEHAEQELSREAGMPYSEAFSSPAVWMPRRSLHIDYTAPARLDDPLALVAYVSRMGNSALTLNVDVMSADFGQLYASATVVTVCVSVSDFRKRSIPDDIRTAMGPFTMSSDEVCAWLANRSLVEEYRGV